MCLESSLPPGWDWSISFSQSLPLSLPFNVKGFLLGKWGLATVQTFFQSSNWSSPLDVCCLCGIKNLSGHRILIWVPMSPFCLGGTCPWLPCLIMDPLQRVDLQVDKCPFIHFFPKNICTFIRLLTIMFHGLPVPFWNNHLYDSLFYFLNGKHILNTGTWNYS